MTNILSYLFLLPLCFAVLIIALPEAKKQLAKWVALVAVGVQVLLTLVLLFSFNKKTGANSWSEAYQFTEKLDWISLNLGEMGKLQIQYFLGIDGISLPLVALASVVLLVGVIASWNIQEKAKGYFALYLVLSSSITGCFIALDLFLFYLCFEFMLLPMFFLIGIWGGARRSYASIKFFLYTLLGSLFILVVMIGLYMSVVDGNVHSFSLVKMAEGSYEANSWLHPESGKLIFGYSARFLAFIFLLIGFGIKLPVVPVHTWLPDAHVEAPTAISVVLAGLLLKVGGYGLFRIMVIIFPDVTLENASLIAGLGVLSILYGGLNALAQKDLKRMVAYSSVSHMGFVLLGIASCTSEGLSGALFHMLSHGLISPALFLITGVIYDRTKNRQIENFSGLATKMPVFTLFVAIFFFAGLGMPGFSGFVGELMVLIGVFKVAFLSKWVGLLATLGILLGAAYFLWAFQRMFLGEYFVRKSEWGSRMKDLNKREIFMLLMLALLVVFLGLYPKFMLDYMSDSIQLIANQFIK